MEFQREIGLNFPNYSSQLHDPLNVVRVIFANSLVVIGLYSKSNFHIMIFEIQNICWVIVLLQNCSRYIRVVVSK